MEFRSPRFAGDALLHAILNDPDSGTLKLEPGSPADSVRPVQRALWDLWWPDEIDPPIQHFDPELFADGVYGDGTTRTVRHYKAHYGLRFPPHAPDGIIDGFAGPRTLELLDRHCELFDELVPLLSAKFELLAQGATSVGTNARQYPVRGTRCLRQMVSVDSAHIHLYATRGIGAVAVQDPIVGPWLIRHGGATGPFGAPVSDAVADGIGGVEQQFEFGSLRFDPASGETLPVGGEPPAQTSF